MAQRLAFNVEWFDEVAGMPRHYVLGFYPESSQVDMIDVKRAKPFLRKTRVDGLREDQFVLGSTVNVLSRQLVIKSYADKATEQQLGSRREKCVVFVARDALAQLGAVMARMEAKELTLVNASMTTLSVAHERALNVNMPLLFDGACAVLEYVGENAIDKAKETCSAFEIGLVGSSSSASQAEDQAEFMFGAAKPATTATRSNSVLLLIKPHAVVMRESGRIVEQLQANGFDLSAMQTFTLDKTHAEEFLEVYRTVVPEYNAMVAELESGTLVALEVTRRRDSANIHADLREFCGPMDPEIARQIRGHTLRARFGLDSARNAVHVTDLADDVDLELEYLFDILM